MVPGDLKYSKEHEWIKVEGEKGRIGITHHAQHSLGDVVFVDLPKPGRTLAARETFAVVESVKAVSDIYAPAGGEVIEANGELEGHPDLVNQDCYGKGWMIVVALANPADLDSLMDAAAYEAYLKSEGAE